MKNEISSVKAVSFGITVAIPYSSNIRGWSYRGCSLSKIRELEEDFIFMRGKEKDPIHKVQIDHAIATVKYAQTLGGIPITLQRIDDQLYISFSFTDLDTLIRFNKEKDTGIEGTTME